MGPTNIALVKLLRTDNALRAAQAKYDAAARNVNVQARRIADVTEKLALAQGKMREQQVRGGLLDSDIKSRDARIDRLRTQQQTANNNKEYQAFLTEINTEKIDKGKVEEESLVVMEAVEKLQAEVKDLHAQLEDATKQHETTKAELGGKLAELQAEIDRLAPEREAAAAAVPARARDAFDRLADRYEGEAMAPLSRPDRRREEYVCGACHMDLAVDLYNKLHTRDELAFCPNCHRVLFIPDELPPELAIGRQKDPKEKKEPKEKKPKAPKAPAAAAPPSAPAATAEVTTAEVATAEVATGATAGASAAPDNAAQA